MAEKEDSVRNIQDCFRLLEIEPSATREEVRTAYKTHVKVWHPDRFPNDPDLRQLAQTRTQEIIAAFRILDGMYASGRLPLVEDEDEDEPSPPPPVRRPPPTPPAPWPQPPSRNPHDCPRCDSSETQFLHMAHATGLSSSSSESSGSFIGYKFGEARGPFGGFTSSTETTVHQTALSQLASPPSAAPLGCGFLLLLVGLIPPFACDPLPRGGSTLVMWSLIGAALWLVPALYYHTAVLPGRRRNWSARSICLRCGTQFYPAGVPSPEAEGSHAPQVAAALAVGGLVAGGIYVIGGEFFRTPLPAQPATPAVPTSVPVSSPSHT